MHDKTGFDVARLRLRSLKNAAAADSRLSWYVANSARTVDEALDSLDLEVFGAWDLGVPWPMTTANVELIISDRGAIPALVAALNSDQPVRVGNAAYCLQLMRAKEGINTASLRLQALDRDAKQEYRSLFARKCLDCYLEGMPKGH